MRKGVRKHGRVTATKMVTEYLTMIEMFERFMWFKQSEGLAPKICKTVAKTRSY
ncbi:hypothetical protein [Bacillus salipaludis]|uniref:Uncharacterized protein n=1 Tax=Bacillus salipaludis TaxID=2547811 RepID=A0ABW8RST6_9BACI